MDSVQEMNVNFNSRTKINFDGSNITTERQTEILRAKGLLVGIA